MCGTAAAAAYLRGTLLERTYLCTNTAAVRRRPLTASPKFFIILLLLLLSFYLFPFSPPSRSQTPTPGTGTRHLYAATGIPSPQYIICTYAVIIKPIPVQLPSCSATRRQSYTYARLQRTAPVTVSFINSDTTVMVVAASLSHRSP
ncbi:unnamed protein product [Aphis gossypii]|uniref:Uncharacterized protein n=1 Tax=Aphis gossypii TaxID=80765 RepID=A0A9P0NST1_APHGO|nr:unnamed protein product [Aphis gossypii]